MKYTLKVEKADSKAEWKAGEDLDEEQREVVFAPPGPILVVAGAGTGKTRALTYRVANFIRQGVAPENILLCTFTNRAAQEMVGRVESLTGISAKSMWAGTFHHVANRLLREFGDHVGLSPGYGILDREDSREVMSQAMTVLGDRLKQKKLPRPNLLQAMVSMAANKQVSLEQAVSYRWYRFLNNMEEIEEVVAEYSRRKAKLNVVDFDDLLLGWLAMMTRSREVAARISERFHHVFVDEYQDVNLLQAVIVDEVARGGHGNLTVVGDDAQSIYSFRGASVDLMLDFDKRYPEAVTMKLQTNYRSTSEILELANKSLQNNTRRIPKVLRSEKGSGRPPANVVLGTTDQQSCFVCQRLLELHQEDSIPLRGIAVLYRAHSHSLELQVELGKRGIPYSVRSGLRFFEQAHIKDVVSFFRVLSNPLDELALGRVFGVQSGLGRKTVLKVIQAMRKQKKSGMDVALLETVIERIVGKREHEIAPKGEPGAKGISISGAAGAALVELAESMKTMRKRLAQGGVREAMLWLVEGPYKSYVSRSYSNAEDRVEDIRGLAEFAARYDQVEPFLSDLALAAQGVNTADGSPEEDKLVLSTIHQAKGLEWQAVFILCLCDGMFPSAPALRDPEGEEEERRLFHVAVTRAKEYLYLCRPAVSESDNDFYKILRPSRFLTELQPNPPFESWEIILED